MDRHHDKEVLRGLANLKRLLSIEFRWLKSHLKSSPSKDLNKTLKKIMATQAEIVADLALVLAQQKKTAAEIVEVQTSVTDLKDQVAELEEIISAGGGVTQELIDAVAAVKAQAQVVDDLIPDVPTT